MQSIAQLIINQSLTGRIYDLQLMYCILLAFSLARALSALERNATSNDLEPPSSQTKFAFKDLTIEFFWDFDDINKEVIMMLAYDWPAFFGFGFGKSMSHADLWVFEIEGQQIKATDHIASKQGYPPTDVGQGGTNDLVILGFQYDGVSKTQVKFKRKQATGDPNDFDLLPNPKASVIFAYGPTKEDYDLTYHDDNRGGFEFRFEQGSNEDAKSQYDWTNVHKWTNIVCWGILVDLAILIPRLFRTSSWRMGVHGLLMGAITAATLVVNALIFKQHLDVFEDGNFGKKDLKSKLHIILGLLGALLIVAQCLGGFFVHWLIKSAITNEAISKKPLPHAILGHVIYVLMKVQIALGIYKIHKYMMQLWIAYSVIFLWRSAVELLFQKGVLVKILVGKRKSQQNQTSEIDNLLNYIELKDEMQLTDSRPWCLFNNQIIDLSNQIHPGGQYIWKAIQGREISRFIYGAYALETATTTKPYSHSPYALAMLARQTIGNLKPIPFFQTNNSSFFGEPQCSDVWTLRTVEPLSDRISYFGFVHDSLLFTTSLFGIESFGRYFILRSTNPQIAVRPYTMILCMAKPNLDYRKQLIKLADSILNKQQANMLPAKVTSFQELPFIIKRYDSKRGFSQCLHSDNQNSQYRIQGPYGVSFGLSDQGHIVIICGGTGLLPFLDLLDYALKATVYDAIKTFAGEEVASLVNYEKFQFKKYSITLFLAVRNEDELIGKDIYFSLLNLQRHLSKWSFKMVLKGEVKSKNIQTIRQPFNAELFKQEIEDLDSVMKFLVCGPPKMNKSVPEYLAELGVPQEKIHLV